MRSLIKPHRLYLYKATLKVAFLLLFLPFALFAETVTLKSGRKIEGKIIEKTNQYIKIELDGAPVYYELRYIKGIDEDKTTKDTKPYLKNGLKFGAEARFKEAEEEFKRGLGINPGDHNLGEALKIIDDLNSAKIKEEYAVYLFKGSNYLINAQYKEAIAEFKEALKLKPDDSDLCYYLGICNYYLEEYRQALNYFQKTQEIKSDDELYYYLGTSHYFLDEYPEAITYLKKVLEINPNDAEAYSVIGTSNYLLGHSELAKENLHKAKELFRNQGDYTKAKDTEDFLAKIN